MPLSTSRSVPGGMPTTAKASPRSMRGMRLGERLGADRHADRAARVQRLHDAPAQLAQVVVDDRDRDLAQDLVEIGLRVVDAVDQRRQDQQDESAADREHAPPFGGEGSADAARRGGGACRGSGAALCGSRLPRSRAGEGARAAP